MTESGELTAEPQAVETPPVPEPAGGGRREQLRGLLSLLGSLQGYIGLILVVAFGILSKGQTFWNSQNITNAITGFATRGILAVGETMVILAAGIDLSVGSMLGLSSMVAAMLLVNEHMPVYLIPFACMAAGLGMGFLNGLGSTKLRIQSFVMTLATLSIFRGIDRQISDNVSVGTQQVDNSGHLTHSSQQFQIFGTPGHNMLQGTYVPGFGHGGIPYPMVAFFAAVIVFQWVLSKSTFGRHIYAVGGNETAAKLSGVNVDRVRIGVFMLAGLLAGLAGPIDAAYNASADPLAGTSYELDAIAAAVIGGANLSGGRGSIVGTLVGALILTLLDNVLGLNAVSDNAQLIIKGLIVVAAVVIQRPDLLRTASAAVSRWARAGRSLFAGKPSRG